MKIRDLLDTMEEQKREYTPHEELVLVQKMVKDLGDMYRLLEKNAGSFGDMDQPGKKRLYDQLSKDLRGAQATAKKIAQKLASQSDMIRTRPER